MLQRDVGKHNVYAIVWKLQCASICNMARAEFGYVSMLANCFVAALKKGSIHIGGNHCKTLLGKSSSHAADAASNF